jgi:hypothetical protein
MIISIVNHTRGKLNDEEIQVGIRAINRQIAHDFEPYWSLGGALRLEGPGSDKPDKLRLPDLRGDAVIYLWDQVDVEDAVGYHDLNARGIPFGFVFTELSKELGESWTVTLSHEALELIGDAQVNLLVMGPHPQKPKKTVFHWYEMCDAVQDEHYQVDGIDVSNFLLPLYFTSDPEPGGRNDFLGRAYDGRTLESFGINPGGYIGFFNPETQDHETFSRKSDKRARQRLQIKGRAAITRRSLRYQYGSERVEEVAMEARKAVSSRESVPPAAAARSRPDYELIGTSKERKE